METQMYAVLSQIRQDVEPSNDYSSLVVVTSSVILITADHDQAVDVATFHHGAHTIDRGQGEYEHEWGGSNPRTVIRTVVSLPLGVTGQSDGIRRVFGHSE